MAMIVLIMMMIMPMLIFNAFCLDWLKFNFFFDSGTDKYITITVGAEACIYYFGF